MPTIKVFEGPLCCNTGVCGTDPEQELVDFTADVEWVKAQGADITRANLAQDPPAFAAEPIATGFLKTVGAEGLPLVIVDGVTAATGRYPSRAELAKWAGLTVEADGREELPTTGGCCGGQSDESEASGCCGGQ